MRCNASGADVLAANESIRELLMSRVAALHDDVVDHGAQAGIADERELERFAERVAVRVADRDDDAGDTPRRSPQWRREAPRVSCRAPVQANSCQRPAGQARRYPVEKAQRIPPLKSCLIVLPAGPPVQHDGRWRRRPFHEDIDQETTVRRDVVERAKAEVADGRARLEQRDWRAGREVGAGPTGTAMSIPSEAR